MFFFASNKTMFGDNQRYNLRKNKNRKFTLKWDKNGKVNT